MSGSFQSTEGSKAEYSDVDIHCRWLKPSGMNPNFSIFNLTLMSLPQNSKVKCLAYRIRKYIKQHMWVQSGCEQCCLSKSHVTFCAWKSHNGTWLCLLESEKSVIAVSRIHSSDHTPNISPILLFYPHPPPSSVPAATYPVPHTQYVHLLSLWSYAEPYSRLFPLPYTRS